MIKVLQMTEDINAKAKTLSSGEKRKLSVGIALISSSKVYNRKHHIITNAKTVFIYLRILDSLRWAHSLL